MADTPTEEEVRHDFAILVDWRYAERREEFDRMLAALKIELLNEVIDDLHTEQGAIHPGQPYYRGMYDGIDRAVRVVAKRKRAH